MVAGMLIVSATVLLGVVEQISGMYALRDTKSTAVVAVMIFFHLLLAFTLLIASRRRIATVAVSCCCLRAMLDSTAVRWLSTSCVRQAARIECLLD
jgi:hypothetical protein